MCLLYGSHTQQSGRSISALMATWDAIAYPFSIDECLPSQIVSKATLLCLATSVIFKFKATLEAPRRPPLFDSPFCCPVAKEKSFFFGGGVLPADSPSQPPPHHTPLCPPEKSAKLHFQFSTLGAFQTASQQANSVLISPRPVPIQKGDTVLSNDAK